MTQGSSLPPLKKNDGKFGIIALVLLLVAGVLWFFVRDCKSGPEAEPAQTDPEVEVEPRAQFAPEIEIPEDDAGLGAGEEEKPEPKPGKPRRRGRRTGFVTERLPRRSSARSFEGSRASRCRPATSEV